MTFSYNPAQLSTSKLYQVRLMIGDTTSPGALQDEEINYFLTVRPSLYGAAALCCRQIADSASGQTDQNLPAGIAFKFSQKAKAYAARAADLEVKAVVAGGGVPYAGGISIADKAQQEQDPDRVPPSFNIGMDDDDLPVTPAGNETEIGTGEIPSS